MPSRLTVGIPFYNNAQTLEDAIRSVYAQSMADFELILIDDGSDDDSYDIARNLVGSETKIVRDGFNRGLAYRLNEIANLAKGDFLARMDADDIMHPHRLELQLERLKAGDSPDLVGSGVWVIDENGYPIGKRSAPKYQPTPTNILQGCGIAHPTIMGRTDWFRHNPYDSSLRRTEDYELWVRTFDHTTFRSLDSLLLFYREGSRFRFSSYQTAMRETRAILKHYGEQTLGRREARIEVLKSYGKEGFMLMASALAIEGKVLSRRNAPISDVERERALAVLQTIQSIALPVALHPIINLRD